MTSTVFVNQQTVIPTPWLNDVNTATYDTVPDIIDPLGMYQTDGVNVLRYIPEAEWPAILNYTSTTDLSSYLQTALTAQPNLLFPNGRFNVGSTLVLRTDAKIRGFNRRGPQLRALADIPIFQLPYISQDVDIERIYFCANASNRGTGIAVAPTGGAFQGYAIGLRVHDCDFARELAYGINADCIVCVIEKNSFGTDTTVAYTPAPGASTFVAFRSAVYPATGNYTNVNCFRRNKVFYAGSSTVGGIQLMSGAGWVVEGNDIEQGGIVLQVDDISRLDFVQNWAESNVSATDLISFTGTAPVYINFDSNGLYSNTTGANRALINYASTVPVHLTISRNSFAKLAGSYVLYDNATTVRTLPANGLISFWDNVVSGDTVGDKCVTGTDFRGGKTSPRIVVTYQTAGGVATILSCSDPGAAIAYSAVGTAVITPSHPLGTSANNVGVVCTGRTANAPRAPAVGTASFTIQAYNDAGALADGIVTATAWGS